MAMYTDNLHRIAGRYSMVLTKQQLNQVFRVLSVYYVIILVFVVLYGT